MKQKFYITTAIDYVNAPPHIGHAFEKVLADALARWHRLKGDKVFYLTGTDENAQKNAEAAKEAGTPTQEFVDKNSKIFIKLCDTLNISNDAFIRTTQSFHKKKSQEIFQKVFDKGDIYKGKYEGLYCQGCESFLTEKDLIDGKCPEHNKAPKQISEDAYFFKLSKYKDQLIKFIENYIVPKSKKNEILKRLKEEGLRDLCVSRANLDWGIDSPIDDKYKIYVWFDALINYVSGANGNWPADVHVVGKGINWFHSVIWPAMLMSAGIELPKKLLVHGYLTFNGQKISKSLGNTVDPIELAKKYPVDTIRYNLLRGSTFEDFDFSEKELVDRHNNELANKLGNLISRTSALAEKYGFDKKTRDQPLDKRWEEALENNKAEYEEIVRSIKFDENGNVSYKDIIHSLKMKQEKGYDGLILSYPQTINAVAQVYVKRYMESFQIDKALNIIFAYIDVCNEFLQLRKPWEDSKPIEYKKWVLGETVRAIKEIATLLQPFIPESAEQISKIFKTDKIKKAPILFKKIIIIANLEPRTLKSIESQGMLLAASTSDHKKVILLTTDKEIENGTKIS